MDAKIEGRPVVVLAGKDKGRTGEVVEGPAEGRARGSWRQPGKAPPAPDADPGSRHHQQGSADPLSNVAIVDSKDGKPTRVGFKLLTATRRSAIAKRSVR
jgi:large subunit ribosomal protein L24